MRYRKKMSRRGSRKHFSRNAVRVHKKNMRAVPMRGGFRI